MVTNVVLGMSLFAAMLILGAAIWTYRCEELDQGRLRDAYLSSLVFVLLFFNFAFQVRLHWPDLLEAQRLVASLAAACFLAAAILMVSVAFRKRRAQLGD